MKFWKYKYKSTTDGPEPIVSPHDLLDEESIVNRFIKVVGVEDQKFKGAKNVTVHKKGKTLSSREDIRKKLANFEEEETICEEEEEYGNNNLEICFINETASDEEEASEDDNPDDGSLPPFPRSKSDWEAFIKTDSLYRVLIPFNKKCTIFSCDSYLFQYYLMYIF